jgi:GNAT superfamily N-acetyltransferase
MRLPFTHYIFIVLLQCHTIASLTASSVSYRRGQKADEWTIATTLAKQLMNPFSVKASRFVVATITDDRKDSPQETLVGWAQIRPLSSSTMRDPYQYDASPGSYTLDQAVDDELWLEFEEDDSVQVPSGWASLPWTKEYRDFSQQAKKRRERRNELVQRQQQQAENDVDTLPFWELASVYVRPEFREQGIGSQLVQQCLQTHAVQNKRPIVDKVYLLTIRKRSFWYATKFAFEIVSDPSSIPKFMQLEMAAGGFISKIIGEDLCCMRATQATLACVTDGSQ